MADNELIMVTMRMMGAHLEARKAQLDQLSPPPEGTNAETYLTVLKEVTEAVNVALLSSVKTMTDLDELNRAMLSFIMRVLPIVPGATEDLIGFFMDKGMDPEATKRLLAAVAESEERIARATADLTAPEN